MSIVIAFLEANHRVGIFADRKRVYSYRDGTIHSSDEVFKVYSISDTIACGITGDFKWGIALKDELLNYATDSASELIKRIKNSPKPINVESTFTLIGMYDNKLPFIFGYKTLGESLFKLNETECSIATSPEQYLENCSNYFISQMDLGHDLVKCSIDTIKFASQQDPIHISDTYNSIEILYRST